MLEPWDKELNLKKGEMMKKQYLLMGALLAAMAMPVVKARTVTISNNTRYPFSVTIWIPGHPKHGTVQKGLVVESKGGKRSLSLDKRTKKSDLYLVDSESYFESLDWAPRATIDVWKFKHPFFVPLSKFITASIKFGRRKIVTVFKTLGPLGDWFFERYDSEGKSYLRGKRFYGSKHVGRVLTDGSIVIKNFWGKWKKIG